MYFIDYRFVGLGLCHPNIKPEHRICEGGASQPRQSVSAPGRWLFHKLVSG